MLRTWSRSFVCDRLVVECRSPSRARLLSSQEKASPREAVTGWPPSDGEICAAQSGGTFATDKQVFPGLTLLLLLSTSRFPLSASFTNSENCDGPFAKFNRELHVRHVDSSTLALEK